MSVRGSRSARCSHAPSRRILHSVFLNACTRVRFVRISVCGEMQHGCEVERRLQLRSATATTALYILSARVVQTRSRLVLLGNIYSRSLRHFWSSHRAQNIFWPSDFADIPPTMHAFPNAFSVLHLDMNREKIYRYDLSLDFVFKIIYIIFWYIKYWYIISITLILKQKEKREKWKNWEKTERREKERIQHF